MKKVLEFKIKRAIIEVKSVETKILNKKMNIGYIKLKSFNQNTDDQLFKEIKKMKKTNQLVTFLM